MQTLHSENAAINANTKIRFVPQIDLNGAAQIDTALFKLYSGATVGDSGSPIALSDESWSGDGFFVEQSTGTDGERRALGWQAGSRPL